MENGRMNTAPRLTIGLPVYNSERYVAESIESLLGQSFTDFELIISDNASTDDTPNICERYAKADPRIRYYRQPRNVGLAPNHNFCVEQARGELFKWAAGDDLYHRDLLLRCVEVLDERPEAVLVHSYTAMIDEDSQMYQANAYPLGTSAPRPSDRFGSMLHDNGGDDDGGVMRTAVLRRIAPKNSYHHADRTTVTDVLPPRPPGSRRTRARRRPGALRQHGPPAREPVAAPATAVARRVPLGLPLDDPEGPPAPRGAPCLLPASRHLDGQAVQAAPPGGLRTAGRRVPAEHRRRCGRPWPRGPAAMNTRLL
jgi:hypothetical protein